MFALTVATILITAVVVATAVWRARKREQDNPKRAGRHRAENRPTMTWRG